MDIYVVGKNLKPLSRKEIHDRAKQVGSTILQASLNQINRENEQERNSPPFDPTGEDWGDRVPGDCI